MSTLRITLIDVGWGDSILLETTDAAGVTHYALIDSNDTTYNRSSYLFVKRHFEKRQVDLDQPPLFDFVILSHEHADHGQGLKVLMRDFGARQFWYPKSASLSSFSELIRFASRSKKVQHHEAVNSTKILPAFGDCSLQILWPPYDVIDQNPNNNSIVLLLQLGQTPVLLTGDAEETVWHQIAHRIPPNTAFFKVPHHGSVNGTFDPGGGTPWLDHCPVSAQLAMSTHIRPYQHPHQRVIDELTRRQLTFRRTDRDYHITFETDGAGQDRVFYHHD